MSSSPSQSISSSSDVTGLLDRLTLPQLQVAEAMAALSPGVTPARLSCLLVGREADARVSIVIGELCAVGVCRLDTTGVAAELTPVAGLRAAFGRPLGLGLTLAEVLAATRADDLRRMARHLGLPSLGRRDATLGPVMATMLEPGAIQAILAKAPDGVLDAMISLAWCEDEPTDPADDESYGWEPELRLRSGYRDDPGPLRWGLGRDHAWARERGLVMSRPADGRPDLPAEVAMALRGPDYQAPFDADRPQIIVGKAPVHDDRADELADRVTGHHWLRLTRLCAELLEEIARKPLPRRRSGELTDPEVKRLGAALGATAEEITTLWALATAAGLVVTDTAIGDARRLTAWSDAEVPGRVATLARAVNDLARPLVPGGGQEPRSYSWSQPRPKSDVRRLRQALFSALAELPPGGRTHLETIEAALRWDAPRAVGLDYEAPQLLWEEALSLCLIVNGSLSPVGRALVTTDAPHSTAGLESLLPAVVDEVSVGADLTATAGGLPTRRVSRVLDATAVRESEDTATIWRFSKASVRRAFDAGGSHESVLAGLTGVSRTPLPDTLTSLIADIARRHGHLVVVPVGAIIRSDDETLLLELRRSAGLGALELRPLAPGMLVAAMSHDSTLQVLRKDGYLPVSLNRTGGGG